MPRGERFGRLLKILIAIEANPCLTPKDLALRCEVSTRTIYRDIEALELAGVPIYYQRTPPKGYKLTNNFFLPPVSLNVLEAISLGVVGHSLANQQGIPYSQAIQSALDKIMAKLPEELRQATYKASYNILFDHEPAVDYQSYTKIFSDLEKARRQQQTVLLNYYSFSRQTSTQRLVDPYALIYRQNAWYLLGFCHKRQKLRMFKVNRIKSLELTEKQYRLPANFKLNEYLANAWRLVAGKPKTVRVRFSGEAARRVREGQWHDSQQLNWLEDGRLLMTVKIAGLKEFAAWLLSFGAEAEVLYPPALRKLMTKTAKALAKVYEKSW